MAYVSLWIPLILGVKVLHQLLTSVIATYIRMYANCTFNSCNMGTSGLPNMYTGCLRVTGQRAEGAHIRQTMSAHVTTPCGLVIVVSLQWLVADAEGFTDYEMSRY